MKQGSDGVRPAEQLVGLVLDDGWRVLQKVQRNSRQTGGSFSSGYIAEKQPEGTRGFLKALDLSGALQSTDPARALQGLTEAYNYERDLLKKCQAHKMSRVATALADGTLRRDGWSVPVPYLIFDLAKCDSRVFLDSIDRFEIAWRLRALHHVAVGTQQLHRKSIAHQDLKPSNVLVFDDLGSKLTDLGRAAAIGTPSPVEDLVVAGDQTYAPLELLYGEVTSDWRQRRMGADLYLLGSLMHFFFADVGVSQAVLSRLPLSLWPASKGGDWGDTYRDILPIIRTKWDEVMRDFSNQLAQYRGAPGPVLTEMVRQLTDPDPKLRGHPRDRRKHQYSLERYVSRLNLLARQLELWANPV